MSAALCQVFDLGRIDYGRAERLQQRLVAQRRAGEAPDRLLICEHDPVVTVGAGSEQPEAEMAAARAAGVAARCVTRGGRATVHCPGQVVAYPILDLREHRTDLHWYLRALEDTIIDALADLGCAAGRVAGHTGVWVAGHKIASIGVAVRGWVTYHGLSVNVRCDPALWRLVNPCGLEPEQIASLADLQPAAPSRCEMTCALIVAFGRRFRLRTQQCAPAELLARTVF